MNKIYICIILLILLIILSFLFNKSTNENYENENRKIPKVIHMTYISYEHVPQKVWDNLNKFAPDYKILFYSDEACKDFIKKNYDKKIFNMYEKLRHGAHKADLFRYCCLYKLGGVYLDIKMKPEKMLNKIFNHNREGLLYTCINHDGKHIFQGLLASYPKNKIFLDLMDDFDNFNNNYHYFTKSFMRIIKEKINKEPTIKYNKIDDDNYIYLFKEKNIQMNNEKKDRYGGYFSIYDGDERIMKTRYTDFPWKKLNNYKVNNKVIEV